MCSPLPEAALAEVYSTAQTHLCRTNDEQPADFFTPKPFFSGRLVALLGNPIPMI